MRDMQRSLMARTACMGGWGCPERGRCVHHLATTRPLVKDRLCEAGVLDCFESVSAVPASEWRVPVTGRQTA